MGARAAAAFSRSMSGVAPFDVRCALLLICLPLAWKLLSLDFTALGDLCDRPPIFRFYPGWLYDTLVANRCRIYSGNATRYMQVAAAALLVAVTIRPSRWLLGPAILLTWLLDTGAAVFRFNFFTIDTPLALLTLVFLAPASLPRAASWDLRPNADARLVFLICLTYVATYYVLAGLAKLQFDWRWPAVVRVGNYYPISFLWHGQTMPEPIDTIARVSAEVLRDKPWLDTASAFVVLVEQFVWLLAPFSVIMRAHAGIFAAGYHIVVALTTGIVFITWIPIALAVSLPFSIVARRFSDGGTALVPHEPREELQSRARPLLFVICIAAALACFPSKGTVVPPFYNYLAFGWRYFQFEEMKPFYRIGYRDAGTGALTSLPLHHAGFLDFMHVGYLDVSARLIVEQRAVRATQTVFMEHARSLLSALRPPDANGWLLGKLRSPVHLLSDPGQVAIHKLRRFVIMKGVPSPPANGRPAQAKWLVCGHIDLDQPSTQQMFTLNETCIDEP